MKKWMVFLLIFLLAGCQLPVKKSEIQGEKGIYYPMVESPEYQRYQSGACYSWSSLAYMDKVYTSTKRYQTQNKWELPLHIIDEQISEVYGNHKVYWSVNKEKLLSNTHEGILYKITDYNAEVKLGLYYEEEHPSSEIGTLYNLILFEHMNDIWLYEGKELYQDRLHLDEAVSVSGLSTKDETVEKFIEALFGAEFIDPKSKELPKWSTEHYQCIFFYDISGLVTELRIYDSGYIVYQTPGCAGYTYFILKLNEEFYAGLLDKIECYY